MSKYNIDGILQVSHNRVSVVDKNSNICHNIDMSEYKLLSVEQVAQLLGVSRSTIYTHLKAKTLPSIKIASRTMVRLSDLKKFLDGRIAFGRDVYE